MNSHIRNIYISDIGACINSTFALRNLRKRVTVTCVMTSSSLFSSHRCGFRTKDPYTQGRAEMSPSIPWQMAQMEDQV